MLKSMSKLTTWSEVLPPCIGLLLAGFGGWVALAVIDTPLWRGLTVFAIVAVALSLLVYYGLKVFNRYSRLVNGRCPYPMCKGVVQRPADKTPGVVVCPTCKRRWPAIAGIKFKFTSRM